MSFQRENIKQNKTKHPIDTPKTENAVHRDIFSPATMMSFERETIKQNKMKPPIETPKTQNSKQKHMNPLLTRPKQWTLLRCGIFSLGSTMEFEREDIE